METYLYRRLQLEAELERIWGWTCDVDGAFGRESRPTAAREQKIEPELTLMEESAIWMTSNGFFYGL